MARMIGKNIGYQNLTPGNPGNKGGGRTPDWLKEKCRDIVDRAKLIDFLADVAKGKNVDVAVSMDGERSKVPAKVKERIAATVELLDRGFGKAVQEVVQMKFVYEFISIVGNKLNQILPESCPHCKKALSLRESTIKELEELSKQMEVVKQ